jgi:phosphoenolpyruvate---glycerone phosphotransferase subunit DhaL
MLPCTPPRSAGGCERVQPTVDATVSVTTWMDEIAAAVEAEADHLTQLDSAIGDGDHGVNMTRGFRAVVAALDGDDGSAPGRLLVTAGKTLVSTVGGASGPLWGLALRRAGRAVGDAEELDGPGLVSALEAALEAVVELGAAERGDKTMVDALAPAVDALRDRVGDGLGAALEAAAEAAEAGARATTPMQARKGRASYLGERSVGHQDPGATSTALIVRALGRAVGPAS